MINAGYVSGKDGAMDVVLRDVNKGRLMCGQWKTACYCLTTQDATQGYGKMERREQEIRFENNQVYELIYIMNLLDPGIKQECERFIEQARNHLPWDSTFMMQAIGADGGRMRSRNTGCYLWWWR